VFLSPSETLAFDSTQDVQHPRNPRAQVGFLVPTALYYCPQLFRTCRMGRPWRAFPLHYGDCRRRGQPGMERHGTSEDLCWNETMVNQRPAHNNSSTAYLNHDHGERKNISFFAICSSLMQNLRRCPSYSLVVGEGSLRVWILRHHSKTEIRDSYLTRVVHKDVWLYRCQTNCNTDRSTITHHPQIPVNHIT